MKYTECWIYFGIQYFEQMKQSIHTYTLHKERYLRLWLWNSSENWQCCSSTQIQIHTRERIKLRDIRKVVSENHYHFIGNVFWFMGIKRMRKKLSFILIGVEVGNHCLLLYGRKCYTIAHIYVNGWWWKNQTNLESPKWHQSLHK